MKTYQNFIDGEFVEHRGEYINVYNPATKECISQIPSASLQEVQDAIMAAKLAQK